MPTRLTQIHIEAEEDIMRLHNLCMQLGSWGGLPIIEQIRLAAGICIDAHSQTMEVTQVRFSVEEKNNQTFLRAEIQNHSRTFSREILHPIRSSDLNSLPETADFKANGTVKCYRDMQQFTYALAHDLKNSLTTLKLALNLSKEEEIAAPLDKYIHIMDRSADRLQSILVSLNKIIQVGDTSPDVVKKISPEKILSEAKEEFVDIINQKEVLFHEDLGSIPDINYIDVYLKSIFSNLLSNSIKYSSPSRQLQISIKGFRENGSIKIIFGDNGQGIDLDLAGSRLFLPFTRFTKSSEGTGIGLYLIKNIVTRNGGKIEVLSKPDEGTEFIVTLKEYELP